MTDDPLRDWLALSFIKDIGPVTVKKLLSAFRSPQKILKAGPGELKDVEGLSAARARAVAEFDSWDKVEEELAAIERHGVNVIKYTDREYPEHLRQLESSPVILYTKGDFMPEDRYAVAMVGSRKMSEYGKRIAERIGAELASFGLTVVSGMARGIDTSSHRGALKAGGRSIAVLGCGLDRPYPPENRQLFETLCGSGCVVSEFPMGTPPNRENFPQRNRLISGLSLGVLVVEATIDSGSLITANYALEQGKDIFAVPGSIASRNSEGTNALIKKGAKLVEDAEDVLEELAPLLKGLLRSEKRSCGGKKTGGPPDGLEINDEEKALCNFLGDEPKHIDIISREAGIVPARLLGLLLGLELKGVVGQAEGKKFYLC